ncbi:MAG: hypothetical protein DMG21_02760 [Acidobacteria bacterium]|nr:MAG: hypothetical protein DMG21_02760 [Acidobacteriota bacterium]
MRKAQAAIWPWTLLLLCAAYGQAQTTGKHCCEGYAFFGRRTSTPGTNVGGAGGDIFMYKGLAVGGDVGTTVGNPDNRITIGSVGPSYHFLCCRDEQKVEPFIGGGYSYLTGDINTHGITYPNSLGPERSGPNFNQGLIAWPAKHLGVRFEVREYRMFVSYGALENVIPGGKFVELRVAVILR